MAKHRHMTALQRKYFGKGHGKVRKVGHHVSHKTYSKVRHVAKHKKHYFSRGGGARGKLGSFAPAIAGLAENVVNDIIPIPGVGTLAVGYGLKNQFAKDYGMWNVGYWAGGQINLGGMLGGLGLGGAKTSAGGYM